MRLVAQGVGFDIADRQLLDGADLEVSAGESVAIVGPSGSGKTTFLAILGGLISPTRGRVSMDPDDVHRVGDVSWVLQTLNVLRDRSVYDNVRLGTLAQRREREAAHAHVLACLDDVGLLEHKDQPVRVLSGGEVQRCVIARALVSAAPFVLADEPTGQLDRHTTESVMTALLTGAANQHRGVVIVTHDDDVARRCDRTMALVDGHLEPQ